LPSNPSQVFDRYAISIVNSINTESESDIEDADDSEFSSVTENTPFIGVASQSRTTSVIAYYGIENHSKWIFTPLFRGSGSNRNTRTNFDAGESGSGGGFSKPTTRDGLDR